MPTFRSTRKGKKCFFCDEPLRLSDRNSASSSSFFFRFRSDFLAFFARISYFKFLEFKEFNKTIIPFALVGLFTISYPTRAHGIIVKYNEYFGFLKSGIMNNTAMSVE